MTSRHGATCCTGWVIKKSKEFDTGLFADGPIELVEEPIKARSRLDPKHCAKALRIAAMRDHVVLLCLLLRGIHEIMSTEEFTEATCDRLVQLTYLWRDTPVLKERGVGDGSVDKTDVSKKSQLLRDAIERHYGK